MDTSENTILPANDDERQKVRLLDYIMGYFPDAQIAKAIHSYNANIKHNGEEGMTWASDKSVGDGNQIMRHLIDFKEAHDRGNHEEALYHVTAIAWRGDELLQRYIKQLPPFFEQTQA